MPEPLFLIKLHAQVCNFVKKEDLKLALSSEFFKMSRKTFSHKTPLVAASDYFEISISCHDCLQKTSSLIYQTILS